MDEYIVVHVESWIFRLSTRALFTVLEFNMDGVGLKVKVMPEQTFSFTCEVF